MNEAGFTKHLDTYRLSHVGCAKSSCAIPKGNSYIGIVSLMPSDTSNQDEKPQGSSNLGIKFLGFATSTISQAMKWRDLDIMFRKGLEWTTVGTGSKNRVRISISSENLLHYVPKNAEMGDLICQIDDNNTTLVLRWDGKTDRYVVVGRASEVPHAGRREQEISRDGAREKLKVYLDAPTLQLVSWEDD